MDMLKIKDKIFNKSLIKYIEKSYLYRHSAYCIDVYFTDYKSITIEFDSEQDRDKEFDEIMKAMRSEAEYG